MEGIRRIDGANRRGAFDFTNTRYHSQSVMELSSAEGMSTVSDISQDLTISDFDRMTNKTPMQNTLPGMYIIPSILYRMVKQSMLYSVVIGEHEINFLVIQNNARGEHGKYFLVRAGKDIK